MRSCCCLSQNIHSSGSFSGAKPTRLGGGNLPAGRPGAAGGGRAQHLEAVEVRKLPGTVSLPQL